MSKQYDKIIIGAGLYGLYSALVCGEKGEKVLVLEYDKQPFMRATYINQARIHMGYHYPRSYTTATKSANYYNQFLEDYGYCINESFDKIYAISKNFSWTNSKQFEKFCNDSKIPCKPINTAEFFNPNVCEGAYLSRECTYDAKILMTGILKKMAILENVDIVYNSRIKEIKKEEINYLITLQNEETLSTPYLLNSSYASVNQIISLLDFEKIKIKYELCEVILCKVSDNFKNIGITVMDGPFFSLMPFGKTGLHTLTSVSHTPHATSNNDLPTFECQTRSNGTCSPNQLGNCNACVAKPETSWQYMKSLAKKYLKEEIELEYVESLFSIKPILKESEIDDSRPTIIKKHSSKPTFVSVLSGKINTVYDLNDILNDD
ncbi:MULTISPECIES: FAD-dependent oxidoreductase [unclassified Flavobacterium]|uniref:FAD-dependent oxidoreductase n=1 Tax=unclassified Flavobacterium TaxID=196869 RepID=UPI000EB27EC9|nr:MULTISPECIES: FAD-dependent oxidoreductase [unclassified Flavobacterium]RKS01088.1 FAD dependent oxidoreductase [Flavobacterium sp. 102]